MQEDLTAILNEIECPDLGIGIVDMGLVYVAEWNAKGIEVAFTTTSPSCPFSELLLRQINDILRRRFREAASFRVQFVLDPPGHWSGSATTPAINSVGPEPEPRLRR